jgi:hypothetical protein
MIFSNCILKESIYYAFPPKFQQFFMAISEKAQVGSL